MAMAMHTHTQTSKPNKLSIGLAAKNDSNFVTILVMPYKSWYHNLNPHNGPFRDSHVITHFKVDIIIYKEPIIPLELKIEPRTKKITLFQ